MVNKIKTNSDFEREHRPVLTMAITQIVKANYSTKLSNLDLTLPLLTAHLLILFLAAQFLSNLKYLISVKNKLIINLICKFVVFSIINTVPISRYGFAEIMKNCSFITKFFCHVLISTLAFNYSQS